jgi:hypothetical protein
MTQISNRPSFRPPQPQPEASSAVQKPALLTHEQAAAAAGGATAAEKPSGVLGSVLSALNQYVEARGNSKPSQGKAGGKRLDRDGFQAQEAAARKKSPDQAAASESRGLEELTSGTRSIGGESRVASLLDPNTPPQEKRDLLRQVRGSELNELMDQVNDMSPEQQREFVKSLGRDGDLFLATKCKIEEVRTGVDQITGAAGALGKILGQAAKRMPPGIKQFMKRYSEATGKIADNLKQRFLAAADSGSAQATAAQSALVQAIMKADGKISAGQAAETVLDIQWFWDRR